MFSSVTHCSPVSVGQCRVSWDDPRVEADLRQCGRQESWSRARFITAAILNQYSMQAHVHVCHTSLLAEEDLSL